MKTVTVPEPTEPLAISSESIDDKGVKQPLYFTLQHFYAQARTFVADYKSKRDRMPTDHEFRAFATAWFQPKLAPAAN